MTDAEPDYSDRPNECPNCGNPAVGHTISTDYCITVQDPEHPAWGCGWLQVTQNFEATLSKEYQDFARTRYAQPEVDDDTAADR